MHNVLRVVPVSQDFLRSGVELDFVAVQRPAENAAPRTEKRSGSENLVSIELERKALGVCGAPTVGDFRAPFAREVDAARRRPAAGTRRRSSAVASALGHGRQWSELVQPSPRVTLGGGIVREVGVSFLQHPVGEHGAQDCNERQRRRQ